MCVFLFPQTASAFCRTPAKITLAENFGFKQIISSGLSATRKVWKYVTENCQKLGECSNIF